MKYEDYIQAVAQKCQRIHKDPFSQTSGSWLYRQIKHGTVEYGCTSEQIYRDLTAQVRLEGLSFTNRPNTPLWFRISLIPKTLEVFLKSYLRLKTTIPQPDPSTTPIKSVSQKNASIVVLSCNRLKYLQTTLKSLQATTDLIHNELIVVDNGSSDGSQEYLRELANHGPIKKLILRSSNHGISPGYNCGFAYADPTTDYLVKLDSDIHILSPGWLDNFNDIFTREASIGLLCLTVVNHTIVRKLPISTLSTIAQLANWVYWIAGGAGMTIPRAVFNKIGYFNESFEFKYMPDDIDYYWRLCMAGYEAYYTKEQIAYHRLDLDYADYKNYTGDKLREYVGQSMRQQNALAIEYLLDKRDYRVTYKHYEHCEFPNNTKILEIP